VESTNNPLHRHWSHDPRPGRSDDAVYRLPQSEVLPALLGTQFIADSSSPSNLACRRAIFDEQYPRLRDPCDPIGARPTWSAGETHDHLQRFVETHAAAHLDGRLVKIGTCPVLRDHVYTDGRVLFSHAIVLGLPMRFDETNAAPEPAAGEEVTRNYMELGGLTLALAGQLRAWGFGAQPHHPRGDEHCNCEAMFVPHAIRAGFGGLGRHGSLISREFGPRVRFSMVTTDAPLPDPADDETGIDEFCTWCTRCMTACPVDAIKPRREMRRGSYRFIVDTSACLPLFAETDGCGICIAVCPYNKADEPKSSKFFDNVLRLDWVKEAIEAKHSVGMEAMERVVRERRAARDVRRNRP
jgi:ferredoxin